MSLTDRREKGKGFSRRTDILQRQGRERARESPDKKLLRFEYGNSKMARLSKVSSVASRSCQVVFSGNLQKKTRGCHVLVKGSVFGQHNRMELP